MTDTHGEAIQRLIRDGTMSVSQAEQIEVYVDLIQQWSQRTRLVSRGDVTRLVDRHVRESLWFDRVDAVRQASVVLDLGSGAGFPGIPLKIAESRRSLILVESKRIKSLFLSEVVERLNLRGVVVKNERLEHLRFTSGEVDVVVARAVSRLSMLWGMVIAAFEDPPVLVTLKGGDLEDEMNELKTKYPDVRVKQLVLDTKRWFVILSKPERSTR
jgi:16S rRNA (guanine527-N7)-methyltransferase